MLVWRALMQILARFWLAWCLFTLAGCGNTSSRSAAGGPPSAATAEDGGGDEQPGDAGLAPPDATSQDALGADDGGDALGADDGGDALAPAVTIIQEDEPGFCAVDGKVLPREGSTSIAGYTGGGFADPDPGAGTSISWSVQAATAGSYSLVWRYAFGGAATNLRDARLLINDVVVADPVSFPYTGTWNDWQETTPLAVGLVQGSNYIRLEALGPGGLGNIDFLKLIGDGITPDTPRFSLTVASGNPTGGTVGYTPVEASYPYGTNVTLTATPSDGYFFQSWSGDVSSAQATFTFPLAKNTAVEALFLPNGTTQDPGLVGYAAVQDDQGTPYLVTGGSLGATVTAATLDELKSYLGSPDPYVVSFSGLLAGADAISVASNKTLLGVGDSAHLDGIGLTINGARNVIIRNVAISHVLAASATDANDAVEITGASRNVWIDHCELFSDLLNGKDYYDGLLDIKNESSFITVSSTVFHDHYKVSLVSSGDEQVADTVIRVTYHHNYFYNCGSRMPSIRFGRAHVFNNFYQADNFGSLVNSRMGAVVKVESNYFLSSQDAIGSWDSPTVGTWDVGNNLFDQCTGLLPTTSTGSLTLPYAYTADAPGDLPTAIPASAGVGKL
jgi:pectate lyase